MDTTPGSWESSYTVFDLLRLPKGQDIYPARHIIALPRSDPIFKRTVKDLRNLIFISNDAGMVVEELFKEGRSEVEARTLAHISVEIFQAPLAARSKSSSRDPPTLAKFRAYQELVAAFALGDLYRSWADASEAAHIALPQVERLIFVSALCADLYALGVVPRPIFLQCIRRTSFYAARAKNLDIQAIFTVYLLSRACTLAASNVTLGKTSGTLPTWVWTNLLRDSKYIARMNAPSNIVAFLKSIARRLGVVDASYSRYATLQAFASQFKRDSCTIPKFCVYYPSTTDASARIENTCRSLSEFSSAHNHSEIGAMGRLVGC